MKKLLPFIPFIGFVFVLFIDDTLDDWGFQFFGSAIMQVVYICGGGIWLILHFCK